MNMDDQLDEIYNTVDELILERRYEDVDRILSEVNIETTDLNLLVAYAVTTRYAKDRLPYRSTMMERLTKLYPKYKRLWRDDP